MVTDNTETTYSYPRVKTHGPSNAQGATRPGTVNGYDTSPRAKNDHYSDLNLQEHLQALEDRTSWASGGA